MGKKYVVESDFDDLHGNPAEDVDLELDMSDSENPIIKAALSNEDWVPPEGDEEGKKKKGKVDLDEEEEEEDDDLETIDEEEETDEDSESEEEEEDGEEEEEDEESETDEEDDDADLSKRAKKRIDRERELRRQEKDAYERRIRKLERKEELRESQRELDSFESESEKKLKNLRKKKAEAKDEGDSEKEVEIEDEILEIRAELKARQSKFADLKKSIEEDDGSAAASNETPEEGKKWLAKYPQFDTNAQFRKVVLLADQSVAARGFDKNSRRYYEEIEKIVAPQFPEIVKPAKKSSKKGQLSEAAKKKRRGAVGGTTKAGTRKSTGKTRRGVVRLTKADQDNMRAFGLDPQNPAHAKEWAANKV